MCLFLLQGFDFMFCYAGFGCIAKRDRISPVCLFLLSVRSGCKCPENLLICGFRAVFEGVCAGKKQGEEKGMLEKFT